LFTFGVSWQVYTPSYYFFTFIIGAKLYMAFSIIQKLQTKEHTKKERKRNIPNEYQHII
jgi:hypothetical protein